MLLTFSYYNYIMRVYIDMGIIYIDIYRLHQTPMANCRIRTLDSKNKILLTRQRLSTCRYHVVGE